MSQYTPCYHSNLYPKINRRISTYEYNKVYERLLSLGIRQGYAQEKSSAKEEYIPPFDLTGVLPAEEQKSFLSTSGIRHSE